MKIEGESETGHFSLSFSRKKPEKRILETFSKYVDVPCTNEQDILGKIESKRFCDDFAALNEKNLISVILFLQQRTKLHIS